MGCCQSAQEQTRRSSSGPGRRSSTEVNKNLTQSEINKRVDSIEKSRTAKLGGVTIRYAYLSQRGYYPEGEPDYISYFYILKFQRLLVHETIYFEIINITSTQMPTNQTKTPTSYVIILPTAHLMPFLLYLTVMAATATNALNIQRIIFRVCCLNL